VGNFARKIIDAVQNTMLDKLFLRLFPLLGLATLWDKAGSPDIGAGLVLLIGLLFFVAWVLGAIARLKPQTERCPLHRLQDRPENGFEVWGRPPDGGLRPPRFMRWLVTTLAADAGRHPSGWRALLGFALILAALVFTGAVVTKPPEFWPDAPWLAGPSTRFVLLTGATALVAAGLVRGWATEQRARLEDRPPPPPPSSTLADYGFLVVMSAAGAAAVVIWTRTPIWLVLAAVVGIAAIGLIPHLRGKVMDVVFGKRLPESPSDR
jgi:hypothetical protein